MKPYLVVANWKMYFSHKQALAWATAHFPDIAQQCPKDSKVIVCPSFDALATIAPIAKKHAITLGAQDCSAYEHGAYTGQVSALSLKELNCAYTIVGHSEVRQHNHDTNDIVARKVTQLFNNSITPIICIDDIAQLTQLLSTLAQHPNKQICLAYEPLAAIGSDSAPDVHHLQTIYTTLVGLCTQNNINNVIFMYGGNVNENTVKTIKNIPVIDGVLIGRASTDFQKIKTIVSLLQKDY